MISRTKPCPREAPLRAGIRPSAPLAALVALVSACFAQATELAGVRISMEGGKDATVTAVLVSKFALRVEIAPAPRDGSPVLKIDLPESGPLAWPAADVEVRDDDGRPLVVQRPGIEWAKLTVPLPAGVGACLVQAVEPAGGWPERSSDRDRTIEDAASGVRVRIATWPGGKRAALSLRFDDSDPSHLDLVDPVLREHGLRGTFMVNPGEDEPGSRRRSDFQARLADWKALADRRDHELANHTAHHRGAGGDEEMDAEIRFAAETIWRIAPHQGRLTALNLGGGTRWTTTRTLRHYLEKYHQFESSGSLGMDDVYGDRVEAFRKHLGTHLERGLWARVHYHGIGDGKGASESNFRAALAIARDHGDALWNAGMAEIHRYQTARDGARLLRIDPDGETFRFRVETTTDPSLYDRPLEIEVDLPEPRRSLRIETDEGEEVARSAGSGGGGDLIRFEVPPRSATYRLRF